MFRPEYVENEKLILQPRRYATKINFGNYAAETFRSHEEFNAAKNELYSALEFSVLVLDGKEQHIPVYIDYVYHEYLNWWHHLLDSLPKFLRKRVKIKYKVLQCRGPATIDIGPDILFPEANVKFPGQLGRPVVVYQISKINAVWVANDQKAPPRQV